MPRSIVELLGVPDALVDRLFHAQRLSSALASVNDEVLRRCHYRSGAPTPDEEKSPIQSVLRMLALKHVLFSFAEALGLKEMVPPSEIETGASADELRALLALPQAPSSSAILDVLEFQRPRLVSELERLVNRLGDLAIASFECRMANLTTFDRSALQPLLRKFPKPTDSASIPFVPAESVRIRDALQRSGSTGTSAALVSAPAVPVPVPDDLQRARADRLEQELVLARERLARFEQRERDEDSTSLQLREIVRSQRARLRSLEHTVERLSGGDSTVASPVSLPSSWEALQSFSDAHLAGRVVLTPKAIRAARRSHFENIPFAYEVLLMLARDYVPMRRGEEGARQRFEESCARLRVCLAPTGDAAIRHDTRALYQAPFLGERLTASMHVQGSSSRDPREGFRLYFAWKDEEPDGGYLIVVSFPSHLDNPLT